MPLTLNQAEGPLLTYLCLPPVVETPRRVDVAVLKARAKLLQKYLCDEQKELQALYALQALVVTLEQPASKSQAMGMGVGRRNCQIAGGSHGKGLNPRKVVGYWTEQCPVG